MKNLFKKLYNFIFNKLVTANLTGKVLNLYLEVPYVEKDIAKKLGAKWDTIKRKCFIADNIDVGPFEQWFPSKESEDENLRAEYFYSAQTNINCYKCNGDTLVSAIILPEGFEAVDDYTMEELEEKGISVKENLFCNRTTYHSYLL